MRYQTFTDTESSSYDIAILSTELDSVAMQSEYLDNSCMDPKDVIAYELHQTGKKTKVAVQKEYLDDLIPTLSDIGVTYLIVTDAEYFKTITGSKKAEANLGYVMTNVYPEHLANQFHVLYCPTFRAIWHNPEPTKAKIQIAMDALFNFMNDRYTAPGIDVLKFADYPQTTSEILAWLNKLIEMDVPLACDIEAFSLKHYSAGIGTIAFAWSQHEGIAFPVDLGPDGKQVRDALRRFFKTFNQKLIYHNISYDVNVLIFQLYMDDISDTAGLLNGLDIMLKNWDDTKLISYLATNTCAGNKLSLKDQAQEFAGNYAVEEIKDITQIPLPDLLEYNLIDACSTWYVYNKHMPTLVNDQQLKIYDTLFKPAIVDIIQMQLTGMPLDMAEVRRSKQIFNHDRQTALHHIQSHPEVQEFVQLLKEQLEDDHYQDWVKRKNNGVKVRPYVPKKFDVEINPNSPLQMQGLLYEHLELPVIERTKTQQPGTGSEILEKLKAYTEDTAVRDLLNRFLEFKAVDKICSTFVPAMLEAVPSSDGRHYLFGNFNLGGTVSGRLSSSGPNLQTIPSTGSTAMKRKYAKLIKNCFKAPEGCLMVGLDFNSLEDMISALTTKDPNKLKVYTDKYDGHCLRAQSYFGDQMPDIDPTSVDSINSVQEKYPTLRQDSKGPTFALTYQGTYMTLIAKFGFSKTVALQIEKRYHELYQASDEWVQDKLQGASKDGYITCAFGLRVRTPLLKQVVLGNKATPTEAAAEGRTAGNALGQSWCLLNSRAATEFMRKVRASKYRLLIKPIAHIHDAQYYVIPDDIEVLMFLNQHLVEAVQWQEHPNIAHDSVKLGGNTSIFYPSWANEVSIPNHATANQIREIVQTKIIPQLEKKAA